MPRNYYECPKCDWKITWAFMPPKPDPDMGLVVAAHIEAKHPEMIYGDIMPVNVYQKWNKLVKV